MDSNGSSDLTSTVATSELQVPHEQSTPNDFQSLRNEPEKTPPSRPLKGYEEVDWTRLKGYLVPQDSFKAESGIWIYGWRLWKPQTDEFYWLCRNCHIKKRTLQGTLKEALFTTAASTGPIKHLKKVHNHDQHGKDTKTHGFKRPIDAWALRGNSPAAAVHNTTAASFDPFQFEALLYDWIIQDNVSFNQLQSPRFQQLLQYANQRCILPHRTSASRVVTRIYDKSIGDVTEQLAGSISKINLSFDLWTSGNKLALLGLCVHFIHRTGKPVTSLLALPKQEGRHSGVRIADTVSNIIDYYGLKDKIGYITTDNASNNGSCMDQLANEYGFDRDQRWIRCCGHIFNLVGQAALFGHSQQLFANQVESCDELETELTLWRRRGPIGRLHNVIVWINRSPQRIERFLKHQELLIKPIKPEDKKDSYQLINDVTTRWNSFYDSAERAVYLQPVIDALLEEEGSIHDKAVRKAELRGSTHRPKQPAIVDDRLSSSDWSVINQYIELLRPLKHATLQLQGHIGSGKTGSIWKVLPVFEDLLTHFESYAMSNPVNESLRQPDLSQQPPRGFTNKPEAAIDVIQALEALPNDQLTAEEHFSINIDLAWKKLNEYYLKLDNTSVYIASTVLHPVYKWAWFDWKWKERPDWRSQARVQLEGLLNEYRDYEPLEERLDDVHSPPKRAKLDQEATEAEETPWAQYEAVAVANIDSQLVEYLKDIHFYQLCANRHTSPINYWLNKRSDWPQLAALALDVYSIAVMSDEPERVFSTTGAAVTTRRRSLLDCTVNELMVTKQWLKAGLIKLDRSYFTSLGIRPASPPSISKASRTRADPAESILIE